MITRPTDEEIEAGAHAINAVSNGSMRSERLFGTHYHRLRHKAGAVTPLRVQCIAALRSIGLTYPKIGWMLNCDHSTALAALKRAQGKRGG